MTEVIDKRLINAYEFLKKRTEQFSVCIEK